MANTVVSDLSSAIDDLLVAITPPRAELEELIRHLERCEELADCAEKLEEDEPKKLCLADFRLTMREVKALAVEHQHKRFPERKLPGADFEKQEKIKESDNPHGDAQAEDFADIHRMLETIDWERIFKALGVTKKRAGKGHLKLMKDMEPVAVPSADHKGQVFQKRFQSWLYVSESGNRRHLVANKNVKPLEVPTSDDRAQVFQKVSESRACDLESSILNDMEASGAYSDSSMALPDVKELSHGDGSHIFGRDGDKDYIIQWLLSDASCNLSTMVIVGEVGVGKTALAKLVYDDSTVKENFSIRAWIHAADGSDAVTICKAIFSSITGKSSCSHKESLHLQTNVQEHVNGKKLLLVLDGIEDLHPCPWEHLRAPFSRVRMAKLLITCRRQSDAQETQHVKFYNLRPLRLDSSWNLFFNCAFFWGPVFPYGYAARLIEIGKLIASKCKGLPLALRVLGGVLAYRRNEGRWRRVLKSHQWESAKSEIVSALHLSYSYMPRELRELFSYCSVFPKGYKINKYELVRLWMAQEAPCSKRNANERMEDVGANYFGQLQRMSLFDRSPDGDGTFIVHDSLYEYSKLYYRGKYSCMSMKGGDACVISDKVRHLYVIGGDESTHNLVSYLGKNLTLKPIQLRSFFYKSSDGTVPKYLSLTTNYLRALDLNRHDDSAAPHEMTHRPCSDKPNFSAINFAEFIHLRYLRVHDTSMESLPASVCELHHLQTLHLDKCSNLKELPNDIGNLVNLRYLELSDASIQMLPNSVCQLFHLQSLILDHCRNLSALPNDIGCLSELHCIGLSGTNIKMLPDSFCKLSKLPILKLDGCKTLMELPSYIGELIGLQSVQVTGTKINRLPNSVCLMYNLLELDMAGSDLVELPHEFGILFKLSRLVLSHTNISVLPESLYRLSSLHTLKLDGCKNLACLPSVIGNLTKLCELLLSDTNIAELPKSICELSELQRLELDGCMRLLSLPHTIGQLTSLCHINLSDTQIAELPASICQLTNLQTLELNGCCRLAEMPADIGNLINLHDLQVTGTQVSELPISLCQLSKLKTLYLNSNRKLQELPSGIENLTNLRYLELSQVAIEVLPKQICQLSRLERLTFEYM